MGGHPRLAKLTSGFNSYIDQPRDLVCIPQLSKSLFLQLKKNSYLYLIEFNKGPNEMKCEVMCADFGIQYIVLNTSYFFTLFLLKGVQT